MVEQWGISGVRGEESLGVSALLWTATPDVCVEDNVISYFQAIVNDNSGGSYQIRRSKARGCAKKIVNTTINNQLAYVIFKVFVDG